MALKQANRSLQIETSLGGDELLLTAFTGEEELSRLFQFDLSLVSMDADIAADKIVGTNLTFSIDYGDGSQKRYFNGFVQRFVAGDESPEGERVYRAAVVPWLWFLTQTTDCRIFQEMTVVEIIEQIFDDLGFSDFDTSQISGTHPTREYCVQYRESDFEFVTRLMEEEGIFYFFKHEDGKHEMVMADSTGAYVDCEESAVDYPAEELASGMVTPHILSWEHAYEFRTGAWAHTDYNFKTPKQKLLTSEKTLMKFQGVQDYEQYDYPGEYLDKGTGSPLARVRMEELELEHNLVLGTSGCKSFTPGGKFKVERHRCKSEENKSFVVKKIFHTANEKGGYHSGSDTSGPEYENRFECFPDSATFRASRITSKPIVQGCQTAIVSGPSGEEIYVDEFGRVKVQFHWDREGKNDDKTSVWMRVSQIHAGKNFGAIDIPRVGEEVIVSFLEGDPDRPIITGRVYHAENMPPFGLPGSKSISGLKSKTYKGDGYNEYVMDDSPGNELIREHGQFDKDSTIENDLREHVLNNRSRDVSVDESVTVGNNRTVSVGVNHSETIGSNQTINVGSNLTETVGVNYAETVGVAMELTVGAMMTQTVGAAYVISVGATMSTSVGGSHSTEVGGSRDEQVGGKATEKVAGDVSQQFGGKHTEKVSGNYTVECGAITTIKSSDKIVFKTGSSSIEMTSSGNITIKGTNIKIEGTAKIEEKAAKISSTASAKNEVKGAMVDVKASAINTIKGALVKIN